MALLLVCVTPFADAARKSQVQVPAGMKTYDSPVYIIYTDVPENDAKEAIIRMTKMAYEYNDRTKGLFAGQINRKLPFYLFNKKEDYLKASGVPDSAGIFTGHELMSSTFRDRDGEIDRGTWHTVQHEGFHQFVDAVIGGDIPTWVNEGLAEYFGEGIFTGDGMVIGMIPNGRATRIKQLIKTGSFMSIPGMMKLSLEEWNSKLKVSNYDQAWSMVHFLAHAEKGKYQSAFAEFLQLVSKGKPWEQAWAKAFGSVEGFEAQWKNYWSKLPENPTLELYAKADVAALSSFLGRSISQKVQFDNFEEFIQKDGKNLKMAAADWLPPHLFEQMKATTDALKSRGAKFEIKPVRGNIRDIVCTLEDGTRIIGSFTLNDTRIGKVTTKIIPSPAMSNAK